MVCPITQGDHNEGRLVRAMRADLRQRTNADSRCTDSNIRELTTRIFNRDLEVLRDSSSKSFQLRNQTISQPISVLLHICPRSGLKWDAGWFEGVSCKKLLDRHVNIMPHGQTHCKKYMKKYSSVQEKEQNKIPTTIPYASKSGCSLSLQFIGGKLSLVSSPNLALLSTKLYLIHGVGVRGSDDLSCQIKLDINRRVERY